MSRSGRFLQQSGGRLNILIDNAGVSTLPGRTLTEDRVETQFATNHLGNRFSRMCNLTTPILLTGNFLLSLLLKPALLKSSTASFNTHVVVLTPSTQKASRLRLQDYNFKDGTCNPIVAYGQAKTAGL